MDHKRFTLHHEPDGTPYARIYLGETVLGQPIRRRRSFPGMSDEEAAAAIREWIAEFDPSDVTLSSAMREYINDLDAAGNSPNTVETYNLYARRYFTPLADKPLRSITTPMLDAHFADLRRRGAGTGPLSARTVNGARFFLSGVFRHYVAAGLCETNPVTGTISQGVGYSNEAAFLDDYDLRLVVAAVAEELAETATENPDRLRHCAAFAINTGLAAGLRIGEVCALRRRDVEQARQTIVVCGNVTECDGKPTRRDRTKSKKTRRVKVTGQYLAALASFYEWQGAYLTAPDGDTPIVTTDGAFISPNRLTKQATKILRDAGVGGATFHTLRHTHAAHLLANGIDPKVVQERLGHADVATTLRLYGHVLPGRDEQAAQTMARLISDTGATGNGRATTDGDPLG